MPVTTASLVQGPKTRRMSLREAQFPEIGQNPDKTLSRSKSSGTPTERPTKRRKPYSPRSLRGQSGDKNTIDDPKLSGILLPVIALNRLAMNHGAENRKEESHLWAPLKILANASNGELATALGIPSERLDNMPVRNLLALLRKDEPLTAIRKKVADPSNSNGGKGASSGDSSEVKSDLSHTTYRKRNLRMSCELGNKETLLDKEIRVRLFRVDEKSEEGRQLRIRKK